MLFLPITLNICRFSSRSHHILLSLMDMVQNARLVSKPKGEYLSWDQNPKFGYFCFCYWIIRILYWFIFIFIYLNFFTYLFFQIPDWPELRVLSHPDPAPVRSKPKHDGQPGQVRDLKFTDSRARDGRISGASPYFSVILRRQEDIDGLGLIVCGVKNFRLRVGGHMWGDKSRCKSAAKFQPNARLLFTGWLFLFFC